MSALKVHIEGILEETTMTLKLTSLVQWEAGIKYGSSVSSAGMPPFLMELLENELYHKLVNQGKERHDI